MKRFCGAPCVALLVSSAASAQTAPPPSATAHATAQIAAPLQIQCSAMHFSSVLSQHTATTVMLPADGSAIIDPSNVVLPYAAESAQRSVCSTSGDVAATYSVSLPATVILTNGTGQSMTVNEFTISTDGYANPYSRVLHNDGTGLGADTFGVGAKLNVAADQFPGTYTGTYVITAQYN